jgi:hypothetical protein
LARNAFANTEQRGTLLGIGLYWKGKRPTLQKLCPAPIKLLSLIAEMAVLYSMSQRDDQYNQYNIEE